MAYRRPANCERPGGANNGLGFIFFLFGPFVTTPCIVMMRRRRENSRKKFLLREASAGEGQGGGPSLLSGSQPGCYAKYDLRILLLRRNAFSAFSAMSLLVAVAKAGCCCKGKLGEERHLSSPFPFTFCCRSLRNICGPFLAPMCFLGPPDLLSESFHLFGLPLSPLLDTPSL